MTKYYKAAQKLIGISLFVDGKGEVPDTKGVTLLYTVVAKGSPKPEVRAFDPNNAEGVSLARLFEDAVAYGEVGIDPLDEKIKALASATTQSTQQQASL